MLLTYDGFVANAVRSTGIMDDMIAEMVVTTMILQITCTCVSMLFLYVFFSLSPQTDVDQLTRPDVFGTLHNVIYPSICRSIQTIFQATMSKRGENKLKRCRHLRTVMVRHLKNLADAGRWRNLTADVPGRNMTDIFIEHGSRRWPARSVRCVSCARDESWAGVMRVIGHSTRCFHHATSWTTDCFLVHPSPWSLVLPRRIAIAFTDTPWLYIAAYQVSTVTYTK